MEVLRKEVDRLKMSENKLMADIKSSYLDITKLKGDILAKDYERLQAIEAVQQESAQKMIELSQTLNAEKLEETSKLVEELNKLQGKISELIESSRAEQDKLKNELGVRNEEYSKLMQKFEEIREAKRLAEARLLSYRFKNRDLTPGDDYTDKDNFDELENELEVFIKFYKKEWNRTKRKIRRELLNIKNIRKQDD